MHYALLVGVNEYASEEIVDLGGCENDVVAMEAYLKAQFGQNIQILSLLSKEATRKAILEGFKEHLGKVQKGNLALFYFSGHGCREVSPAAFVELQEDDCHENICPHDSEEGAYDIADKELNLLVRELSVKEAEVVAIFDCCHSGSGLRNSEKDTFRVIPTKEEARPVEEFLPGVFKMLEKTDRPNYVHLAACAPKQYSRERKMGFPPQRRGLFTSTMLSILKQTGQPGLISYHNLMEACRMSMLRKLNSGELQTPKLEISGKFDGNKMFLQTQDDPRRPQVYSMSIDPNGNWRVNLGRVHGLSAGSKDTQFAVYADKGLKIYAGDAMLDAVGLFDSTLRLPENFVPLKSSVYSIAATYLALERLPVFVPHNQLEAIIQGRDSLPDAKQLHTHNHKSTISKQEVTYSIDFVDDPRDAMYAMQTEGERIRLFFAETREELVPTEHLSLPEFHSCAQALMHIARWERLNGLKNENSTLEQVVNKVEFSYKYNQNQAEAKESITLDVDPTFSKDSLGNVNYEFPADFSLYLENASGQDLHMVCFYLSRYFEREQLVDMEVPSGSGPKKLDHVHVRIPVPKNEHLNQVTDSYTVICSAHPIPYLNLSDKRKLSEVLIQTRDRESIDTRQILPLHKEAWFAHSISLKVLRILGALGDELSLAGGKLTIGKHTFLTGNVSLASSAEHMRIAPADRFIKEKMDDHDLKLIDFSQINAQETILELHHISGKEHLAKEPLVVRIDSQEELEDKVLAITLPTNLEIPEVEIEILKDEHLVTAFPILSEVDTHVGDILNFLIHDLPPNPDDGRAEPGRSCKISFVSISKTKYASMVKEAADGKMYLTCIEKMEKH